MPVKFNWVGGIRSHLPSHRIPYAVIAAAAAVAALLLSPGTDRTANANASSFTLNGSAFGANEQIRIVFGSLTRESSDFIWTFSSIYIVPAGSVSSGGSLNDVSGAPNSVMGISGTGIVDELIGITAPSGNIGTGTYVVIEDSNQDGKFNGVDSIGPSFTVTVPANVPPLPNAPYAQMKARATEMAEHWREVHAAYEALFALADAIDIYGALTDPSDTAMYIVGQTLGGIFDVKKATLQTILSVEAQYKGIAADPPDPAFMQPTLLPASDIFDYETADPTQNALEQLANALGQEEVITEALLASIERYQGADIANNGEWALAQARDIKRHSEALQTNGSATASAAANLSTVLGTDTRDYTTESFNLNNIANAIGTSGFTDAERRDLRNLGLSDSQIDDLETEIANTNWTFATTSFQTLLNQTGTLYSNLDVVLADLINGMDGIITVLENDPGVVGTIPTADAGGPYTGDEGTSINLDASASAPGSGGAAISSYAWDLDGDGVFDDAVGQTPSEVFNQATSIFVGVLVTDGNGNSAVDYAPLTVNNVNSPPTIDSASPSGGDVDATVGVLQPFSVTVSDPDTDTVTVAWELNEVPVGTGTTFNYTPSGGDEGPHVLVATASDDSPLGGQTQRLWLIQVNNVDGDSDLWNQNVDCDDAAPGVNPGATEIIGNFINDDCDAATPDSGTPPTASFQTNPQFGAPAASVQFISTSTDPDDTIVGWEWDFDDDGVIDATTSAPTTSFPTTGSFPVTLIVTDSANNTDSVTQNFLVAEAPTAAFTVNSGPKVTGFPIGFTDASTDPNGSIVAWEWDFGDGGTSNLQNPTHIFTDTGIQQVELTVTDDEGAFDTVSQSISVGSLAVDAGQDRFVDEGSDVQYTLVPGAVPGYVPNSNVVQLPMATFLGTGAGPGTTATIDWGEGAGPEPATVGFSSGFGLVQGTNVYEEDGVYNALFCVTPPVADPATACDTAVITVNNINPLPNLFDLSTWTPESYAPVSGFPVGQWNVASDRRSVTQVNNGQPTYFASDFDVFESESTVRIRVSGGDDDMIGFALGFIPGDTTNPDADYILLDWKRGTQGFNFGGNTASCTPGSTALRGLAVSRVTGIPTADELWGHVNFTRDNSTFNTTTQACLDVEAAGVEELARAATLGATAWTTGVTYRFDFIYTATNLKIWVDDVLQFDIDGTFPNGRLGFYNFSQAGVTYSALGVSAIGAFEGDPLTVIGDYQDPGIIDTHAGTINWGDSSPFDGLILTPDVTIPSNGLIETPVHVFRDNGTFLSLACVEDDDGGIGCKRVTINVSNVAPAVSATDDTIGAGQTASTDISFIDPGADDVHFGEIDWGDGSPPEVLGVEVPIDLGDGTIINVCCEVTSPLTMTHVYSAVGVYTVTVTITDDDGGVGVAEATVTVEEAQPQDPVSNPAGPYSVDEGSNVQLDGTGSFDPDGNIMTFEWDLDEDGVFGETGGDAANGDETGATPTFDASSLNGPGSVVVSLMVTDNDGLTDTASTTVDILNVAPTADSGGPYFVDEGSSIQLNPSGSDPIDAPTFAWDLDNNGTFETPGATPTFDATALDGPAVFPVTIRVFDGEGGSTEDSTTVTVNNVAPAVDATGDTIDEGGTATVSGNITDPGVPDSFTVEIHWGDGSPATVLNLPAGSTSYNVTHAYPDDDPTGTASDAYSVSVTVTDDDTGVGTAGATVTVNNVAPTVDATGDTIDEGGTATVSGNITDPGVPDSFTVEIDWGDGSLASVLNLPAGSTSYNATRSFDDNGSFNVTVTVTDDDTGVGTAETTVTVDNVAPTATLSNDGPVDEGQIAAVSFSGQSDPSSADTTAGFLYSYDFNNDGTFDIVDSASASTAVPAPDNADGPTALTVAARITDKDGGSTDHTTVVDVLNVAPLVEAGPDVDATAGGLVSLAPATYTDPGLPDTHTATINWGDGTIEPGTVTGSAGAGTVQGSHSYSSGGIFTVTVTVTDDDGGTGQDTFTVNVIEEQTGFMTGGGNVSEGRGKDASRVSWGFVARCDGSHANFQFNDHSSGSKFHLETIGTVSCWDDPAIDPGQPAVDFDSLLLTGTGRWNGESGATIEVTVTDNGEPGRNDTLEIKIWDASGVLVETIPTTLSGGNHQAHDGKEETEE